MKYVSLLQFVNAKGVGDAAMRRLAGFVAREGVSVDDVVEMQSNEIATAIGITNDIAQNVLAARDSASHLAETFESAGIDILWLVDERYPERLKAVLGNDAPPVLFVKGDIGLLFQQAVGFCGSRKASERGLAVTDSASRILAQEHICVVSGYAHGVDMAAHRGAMEAGGTTVMVLVDGILRFQVKKEIQELLTANNHLFLSQFPPNIPWIGRNAMKRNQTIIGLSDAMILVESGRAGGTFAAGSESLKRRHPLFVIDFAEPGPSAEANPYFIERGGIPIRGTRERVPNLTKVVEIARDQRWREKCVAQQLF